MKTAVATIEPQERGTLPSASKFEIVACCNGQPQLEAQLRERGLLSEDKPDEYALRGTRIHHALETGDVSQLSEDEMQDWARAGELDATALIEWMNDKDLSEPTSEFMEQRLWLTDSDGNQLCSGQYDRLTICGNHAYVRDFKSGFARRLSPSEQSWQLRLLAVLVWLEYGQKHALESVRASFIKPKFGKTAIDTVEYSVDDLMRANNQILQVLWQAQQPGAQRNAGDWCYYCKCRGVCPESGAMSMLPVSMAKAASVITKKEAVAAVDRLTPVDWKQIWERSTVIRNILDTVNDRLKELRPEQLDELGLQVGKGKRLDPIVHTYAAYKVLEHALPQKLLWESLKFSKGALVEALMSEKQFSEKDAEQWIRDNLEMFIETKTSEGSLEEI